jgi:hypothetical protein
MKPALVLHSWYGNPKEDWYPWLKNQLIQKDYQVSLPEIPTMATKSPDLPTQLKFIANLKVIGPDTLVIGHSLGSLLGLRLAEKYTFAQLILVAGWDFNDLTPEHQSFWPKPINHSHIKQHVSQITVIHSDNDPYITAIQAEDMSKRLGGKFILVKGASHFTQKNGITQLPQILPLI